MTAGPERPACGRRRKKVRAKLIKEEHLARAEELVQQMTLEEKVAQLGSFGPQQLLENGRLSQEGKKLLSRGIGQISRPVSYTHLDVYKRQRM